MDNSGGLMGNGQKLEVKTRQKDVFQTQQKEEIKEQSLTGAFEQLDSMFSGQLSVNKKAIPKDNIPDPKSNATELLQNRASLQEEPRELHVAMDGDYQLIEKEDGKYMTQLKTLLNGNSNLRADGIYEDNERVYFDDMELSERDLISSESDHMLRSVVKKMDEIVSTCRKYRLTHLWPWTQRGKERKADVIKVQKEAERRRKLASKRLDELEKDYKRTHGDLVKEDKWSVVDKATSGYHRVVNYGKTFLWGMTVRNAINTVGMAVASPFWLLGTLGRSVYRYFTKAESWKDWRFMGAFTLPHPHLPAAWYNHYATKSIEDVAKSEQKKLTKKRDKYPKDSKEYQELSAEIAQLDGGLYRSRTARWHSFFSGSSMIDDFGYTRIGQEAVDYNNMQQI